jgi:hypothetical protein
LRIERILNRGPEPPINLYDQSLRIEQKVEDIRTGKEISESIYKYRNVVLDGVISAVYTTTKGYFVDAVISHINVSQNSIIAKILRYGIQFSINIAQVAQSVYRDPKAKLMQAIPHILKMGSAITIFADILPYSLASVIGIGTTLLCGSVIRFLLHSFDWETKARYLDNLPLEREIEIEAFGFKNVESLLEMEEKRSKLSYLMTIVGSGLSATVTSISYLYEKSIGKIVTMLSELISTGFPFLGTIIRFSGKVINTAMSAALTAISIIAMIWICHVALLSIFPNLYGYILSCVKDYMPSLVGNKLNKVVEGVIWFLSVILTCFVQCANYMFGANFATSEDELISSTINVFWKIWENKQLKVLLVSPILQPILVQPLLSKINKYFSQSVAVFLSIVVARDIYTGQNNIFLDAIMGAVIGLLGLKPLMGLVGLGIKGLKKLKIISSAITLDYISRKIDKLTNDVVDVCMKSMKKIDDTFSKVADLVETKYGGYDILHMGTAWAMKFFCIDMYMGTVIQETAIDLTINSVKYYKSMTDYTNVSEKQLRDAIKVLEKEKAPEQEVDYYRGLLKDSHGGVISFKNLYLSDFLVMLANKFSLWNYGTNPSSDLIESIRNSRVEIRDRLRMSVNIDVLLEEGRVVENFQKHSDNIVDITERTHKYVRNVKMIDETDVGTLRVTEKLVASLILNKGILGGMMEISPALALQATMEEENKAIRVDKYEYALSNSEKLEGALKLLKNDRPELTKMFDDQDQILTEVINRRKDTIDTSMNFVGYLVDKFIHSMRAGKYGIRKAIENISSLSALRSKDAGAQDMQEGRLQRIEPSSKFLEITFSEAVKINVKVLTDTVDELQRISSSISSPEILKEIGIINMNLVKFAREMEIGRETGYMYSTGGGDIGEGKVWEGKEEEWKPPLDLKDGFMCLLQPPLVYSYSPDAGIYPANISLPPEVRRIVENYVSFLESSIEPHVFDISDQRRNWVLMGYIFRDQLSKISIDFDKLLLEGSQFTDPNIKQKFLMKNITTWDNPSFLYLLSSGSGVSSFYGGCKGPVIPRAALTKYTETLREERMASHISELMPKIILAESEMKTSAKKYSDALMEEKIEMKLEYKEVIIGSTPKIISNAPWPISSLYNVATSSLSYIVNAVWRDSSGNLVNRVTKVDLFDEKPIHEIADKARKIFPHESINEWENSGTKLIELKNELNTYEEGIRQSSTALNFLTTISGSNFLGYIPDRDEILMGMTKSFENLMTYLMDQSYVRFSRYEKELINYVKNQKYS